jgi:arsenate reductase
MGCGDSCPLLPGKRYEDWEMEDPDGKTLDQIRIIRDQIKDKVTNLLQSIGSDAQVTNAATGRGSTENRGG